jgi:hypothetical protein
LHHAKRLVQAAIAALAMASPACLAADEPADASNQDQGAMPAIAGVIEQYSWARTEGGKFVGRERATWISGTAFLADSARFTFGYFKYGESDQLDENFLELGDDGSRFRLGRIRPSFGFSDWSEGWYYGLINAPMVRFMPIGDTRLLTMGSGAEVRGGDPKLQYQVSLVDMSLDEYQVLPDNPSHLFARVQTYGKGLIVGLNAISGVTGSSSGTRAYGLDARWTTPQFQARGEYVVSGSDGFKTRGYYLDLFYKPFGLPNTTFVGRAQAISAMPWDPRPSEAYTLGIKQVVWSGLTIDLNYTFGNDGAMNASSKGWAIQAMSSVRF